MHLERVALVPVCPHHRRGRCHRRREHDRQEPTEPGKQFGYHLGPPSTSRGAEGRVLPTDASLGWGNEPGLRPTTARDRRSAVESMSSNVVFFAQLAMVSRLLV